MPIPIDLVLVRHGESEANLANTRSREFHDHSDFTKEDKARHCSKMRLTEKGIKQARAAGAWIRDNIGDDFDGYHVSEFLRTIETAAQLGLENANWRLDLLLRETDYGGTLDLLSGKERKKRFGGHLKRQKIDGIFWIPPTGGESIAQACLRVKAVLSALGNEWGETHLLVTHGEMMRAFRICLEHLSHFQYAEIENSADPKDKIHSCQILHYARRDPAKKEAPLEQDFSWVRSVCPWDPQLSSNEWRKIENPLYSNNELLALAENYPRLVNHD